MSVHKDGVSSDSSASSRETGLNDFSTSDTLCGLPKCHPSCLQKFANAKSFLLFISLLAIAQGFAVNGINNVNIVSYERRFLLSSQNAGLVASMYDIAAGLTVIFVGYFGGSGHQPRVLGSAAFCLGLGTLVMALAHFTSPDYAPGTNDVGFCSIVPNGTLGTSCVAVNDQSYLKNYLYVLLLGQALNGYAGTCLYTLGVTYLDESVSTKLSPLYIGIMTGCAALGPAIGYILGGYLLNIYVDFPKPPPESLTPDDPGWVGAWWLGFLMSFVMSMILAGFLFMFPRELPSTAAVRAAKVSQAHHDGSEDRVNKAGFGVSIKDMPRSAWYLLKNPAYMCITVVVGIELILAAGYSTFLPKFINNQLGWSSSFSAILTGLLAVPGAALGQVLGGYFCKRFKLKVKGMLKMVLCFSIGVLVVTPVFWARCDDVSMAGVLTGYPGAASVPVDQLSLSSTCNAGCGCDTSLYDPVCGDGTQYFSACYAGCQGEPELVDGTKVYNNCSCPLGDLPTSLPHNATVTAGMCEVGCLLRYVFIPFCFLVFIGTFMMGTPLTVATLRVVPEKQRAFAVSFQWVFLRFLGSIPGPILFGAIIDSSCTVWEDDCGVKGACWIYDNFEMSKRLFLLTLVVKIISIIFNILGFVLYKAPPESSVGYDVTGETITTISTTEIRGSSEDDNRLVNGR